MGSVRSKCATDLPDCGALRQNKKLPETRLKSMFCITVRHDSEPHLDVERLASRLRDAVPAGLHLTNAYVDAERLLVYVEPENDGDPQFLVEQFTQRLGLALCGIARVYAVPVDGDSPATSPASPVELADVRPAEMIEAAATSADGRTVTATVRYKPHEQIDHIDVKERDDAVELTVWVGSRPDDARRFYVTIGEAFGAVSFVLDEPLGTRPVVDGQ